MRTIRVHDEIELILFPDNQPQVRLRDIEPDDIRVVFRIQNSVELLQLAMLSDALDRRGMSKKELVIPYLLGARSDRLMNRGESIGLKVIADIVNSCGFEKVKFFDVHSDAATLLINHSENIPNKQLVERYNISDDTTLICPDAGASKKIDSYCLWNPAITDVAHCVKTRDMKTGGVTLKVLEPERCEGRDCVIIDDICDGGATFLAIASQIKPNHLTLIVSHGIFSKGARKLTEAFDWIITSNSYQGDSINHPQITIEQLDL